MLHQTFLFLGQLWQLFEVSQILEFLQYFLPTINAQMRQQAQLSLCFYYNATFFAFTCIAFPEPIVYW